VATNLIDAKVTVPGTPTSRSFGDHLNDKVDVRDFGAVGDGVTDDTAAIQAAVNYACNNGKVLIFTQAQQYKSYLISAQIVIPWGTYNWAIRGEAHRTQIKQKTNNTPFLHFDSYTNNPPNSSWMNNTTLTNGEFDISGFAVAWTNNQPVANTRAAVIEFNDGGYADFVLENLECVNGARCVTHQYPGQTAGRPLNTWGYICRHFIMEYSSSGAAIYLRSNPTEGLPNILIEHIYSVQQQSGEELIHLAGATNVTIINVEQNFCSFTPAFVGWAGTGNIRIIGWRCEQFHWGIVGTGSGLFSCNGDLAVEYQISSVELRFNYLENTAGDNYLIQTSGARCILNGFLDIGTSHTSGHGNVNLVQMTGPGDLIEIGIGTIAHPNIQFCRLNDSWLSQIHFTGGTNKMRFYKNSLTTNMSAVINDDTSNIKGQVVAEVGWIWSLTLELDTAITAGSVQVVVYKNGTILDNGNMAVTVTSGKNGQHFNQMLKNQNNTAYQAVEGDVIDVRFTTGATLTGPANAKVVVGIANI
jgi:hypothetical protein